ncbi:MAG: hypothetical protein ABJG86_17360 [Nitratireductor sp.]|jgi:hypothetical protein|uniref:hypothetical protein n=1 Tax=Alphaproteobacteria TaxID=28211 RepID=UPI003263A400
MYVHSLIAGLLFATVASAGDMPVFHTLRLDNTTVNLSLLSSLGSTEPGYDFDVVVGLTELDGRGQPIFRDRGRHRARVRCGAPASVFVGGADHAIGLATTSHEPRNWKTDLWRTICSAPTS